LPAGASLSTAFGFPILVITQACNFERWDFSGWSVSIQTSNIAVSFTDCRFRAHPDSGMQALYGGGLSASSGISVMLLRCVFDGATNLPPTSPTINPHPPQNLLSVANAVTASRCVFVGASGATINCNGPTSFSWCYFGCPAQKVFSSAVPELNSHAEVANISGGEVAIDHCLFDCADGAEQARSVHAETCMAGLFLWQARDQPLVGVVSNSLLLIRNLPSFYTMQADDSAHGLELTFTNNVIQRPINPLGGAGGYLAYAGSDCHGSGNLDFDSGALIAGQPNAL
jgi:hypothetical protein